MVIVVAISPLLQSTGVLTCPEQGALPNQHPYKLQPRMTGRTLPTCPTYLEKQCYIRYRTHHQQLTLHQLLLIAIRTQVPVPLVAGSHIRFHTDGRSTVLPNMKELQWNPYVCSFTIVPTTLLIVPPATVLVLSALPGEPSLSAYEL
jgi:hypothetical protein